MAARRSSSRRTTPQPTSGFIAPPPSRSTRRPDGRPTRASRSQSRELSEPLTVPAGGRATRRSARQASVESASSVGSHDARATRATRRTRNIGVGDLTTVDEDDQPNPDPANHADQQPAEVSPASRSLSRFSNISGTTAVTSHSATEAADLDPEEMLEEFGILYRDAERLLSVVAPTQASESGLQVIAKEARVTDSKVGRRLDRKSQALQAQMGTFASGGLIHRNAVVRSLLQSVSVNDLPSAAWRPDEFIFKANLAWIASRVLTLDRNSDDAWREIRELDSNFPLPFLASFLRSDPESGTLASGSSGLLEETFMLGLEIRTQYALIWLGRSDQQSDISPHAKLAQVFFEGPAEQDRRLPELEDAVQNGKVRGWNVEGLGAGDVPLPQEFADAVVERVETVASFFPDGRPLQRSYLERLQAEFNWLDFTVQVLEWVRRRNAEIETLVKGRGGVDTIVSLLKTEYELRKSARTSTPAKRASKGSDLLYNPIAEIKQVKERLNRLSGRAELLTADTTAVEDAGPPEQPAVEQAPQDDDWQPVPDDQEDNVDHNNAPTGTAPSSTAKDVADVLRMEKQNKENLRHGGREANATPKPHFTDPQKNAKRVEWSESLDPSQSTQPQTQQPQGGNANKRPLVVESEDEDEDEDEDPSEDGGFQQDRRTIDVNQRRKELPAPKRRRFVEEEPVASSATAGPSGRHQRPRPDDVASDTEAEPAPTRSTMLTQTYRAANAEAKNVVARSAPLQRSQPRQRKAWTEDELDALIRYIEDVGCSWALIKRIDNELGEGKRLGRRTQVDLKDKARNMKFDYLKSRIGLPTNFEGVSLHSHHAAKLEELGIPS